VYRPRYQNYLRRIEARINAKKLDLQKFYQTVKLEVKNKNIAGDASVGDEVVMDDDENPNW
jgi:hypothetical protein